MTSGVNSFTASKEKFNLKNESLDNGITAKVASIIMNNEMSPEATSVFLKSKLSGLNNNNELATSSAFVDSIVQASSIVPKDKRDNFFKSCFDPNNDGKFDNEDIKKYDINNDGFIKYEEMSLFLKKEAIGQGANFQDMKSVSSALLDNAKFDKDGKFDFSG